MSATYKFDADRLLGYLKAGIYQGLDRLTLEYQKNMRKTLSEKGTGKSYRGGNKRRGSLRRRSVPGSPPAVDTGALRNSVVAERQSDKDGLKIRIPSIKWYGFMLDAGSSRIAARPWINRSKPVKERIAKVISAFMKREMSRFSSDARRGSVS